MSKLTILIVLIYQFFYFRMKEKKKFIDKVLFFCLYFFSDPNRRKKMSFSQFFSLLIFFLPYFLRSKQSLSQLKQAQQYGCANEAQNIGTKTPDTVVACQEADHDTNSYKVREVVHQGSNSLLTHFTNFPQYNCTNMQVIGEQNVWLCQILDLYIKDHAGLALT